MLILDDYHLITEKAIHASLQYLIEYLPPQLHLIIATRADPPLPLMRWQARSQMQEIRAEQLRCTEQETGSFLREVMNIELAEPEGYIRRFVDEGPLMASMLVKLRNQQHMRNSFSYLDQLIAAFPDEIHLQKAQRLLL